MKKEGVKYRGAYSVNIFFLDNDPKIAVKYYVDKHVLKMPLETAQLLCGVHHVTSKREDIPYRLSHKNHPCSVWARASLSNYLWLVNLGFAVCAEYTFRYGKIHACRRVIEWCGEHLPNIKDKGFTQIALAMPDKYKDPDPVKAYRLYYLGAKSHLFSWKKREVPSWIRSCCHET